MDTDSELPATRGRAFTRESLVGENRINVFLFAVLAIPEFKLAICRLLGLSDDARFKREVIPGTQLRPDFLFEDGELKGCIEVELGGPDNRQIRRYEAELGLRTKCLVGPAVNSNGSHSLEKSLSWREKLLRKALQPMGKQQRSSDTSLNSSKTTSGRRGGGHPRKKFRCVSDCRGLSVP